MDGWWRTARGQAAIGYLAYGMIYLIGAVRELDASRMRDLFGGVPWWAFYVVGAGLVVVFPILIARGYRILTALLAVLTAGKALYLFYGLGKGFSAFNLGFALVALTASVLLTRAVLRPAKHTAAY